MSKYTTIYGIPAMCVPSGTLNNHNHIIDTEYELDEDPWFDFEICYSPEINKYTLGFETLLKFEKDGDCKEWIEYCKNCVEEYLDNKGIDTTYELDMYEVFTQGINVNTEFDSLEQLFAYLKFAVNGFNGNGM